jgi:carbon-monoxide dehydrogenase small subunit
MTPAATVRVAVTVNGRVEDLVVPAATTLVELLRSHLRLTGTKVGCGVGECGACTVLVDDEPVLSCLVLAAEFDGRRVATIEDESDERVRRLQQAFVASAGLQCGFCTPGMILAASRLPPDADDGAIRAGLVGNICRCTGYSKIVTAVRRAGRTRAGRGAKG